MGTRVDWYWTPVPALDSVIANSFVVTNSPVVATSLTPNRRR